MKEYGHDREEVNQERFMLKAANPPRRLQTWNSWAVPPTFL